MQRYSVGVVGNPNCGKTTIFNALTGGKHRVGNWPGVTVEKISGSIKVNSNKIDLIDLPGIYSLSTCSQDEEIARDFILGTKPDLIVNVVDASHLERNLYLTLQLIEMRVPILIVLNMMDRVKQRNLKIKVDLLSKLLGCSVVCTVANKRQGVLDLKEIISKYVEKPSVSDVSVSFNEDIESAIRDLTALMKDRSFDNACSERWFVVKLLEGDCHKCFSCGNDEFFCKVQEYRDRISSICGEDADIVIAEGRYGFINAVSKKVVDRRNILRKNVSDVIDKFVLNRFFGIPFFLLIMYLVFWVTINLGGCFIDFFDILSGTIFVDGIRELFAFLNLPEIIIAIFSDGIGGGIQTISTFIPPIFFMFLCLSIIEDSGYMARGAFIMDRFMRAVGLPGKAFVPMLVGFGCNVPAIMSARTLENENDRTLTILINPFMSCGARLPVYALFCAAFFPDNGGVVVFSLYLIGIIVAILSAFLFKKTIFRSETSAFIMELPPYHMPTIKGLFVHTWDRLQGFIWRAGKAILCVVILLSLLNAFHAKTTEEVGGSSFLSRAGKSCVAIFKPMGISDENWPAAVGVFTGIFAKESVVATLDTLYSEQQTVEVDSEYTFDFFKGISEAFVSVPSALKEITIPFDFSLDKKSAGDANAVNPGVKERTYTELRKHFDGKAGAFSYLLLILLYMPCVAAIAAVYRELGVRWTLFSCFYMSVTAWITATLFYQICVIYRNPFGSFLWILFCLVMISVICLGLSFFGNKNNTNRNT